MLIRTAGRLLSSRGPRARLLILMYHRVLRRRDPLVPDAVDEAEFETQLGVLARNFTPLPLSEAAVRLRDGTLPPRVVVVTFDDGYRDNHDVALPLLERYGVPATFFIATGFLDGGIMWNDMVIEALRRAQGSAIDLTPLGLGVHPVTDDDARYRSILALIRRLKYEPPAERQEHVARIAAVTGQPLPDDIMMSSRQVLELSERGMEIGGHTLNHPILSRIDARQAEREIVEGRSHLEEITGSKVRSFAYPNGKPGEDYRREHVDMLHRNGFSCAVSTSWGCATYRSDIMQLPRIAPWDRTASRFAARLLLAYRQDQAEYL